MKEKFSSQTLRQLLVRRSILVIPGVYDCTNAKLAEQSGFEVVATSGSEVIGQMLLFFYHTISFDYRNRISV